MTCFPYDPTYSMSALAKAQRRALQSALVRDADLLREAAKELEKAVEADLTSMVAGLDSLMRFETTAQERQEWQKRADDAGRLSRDFNRLLRGSEKAS